MKYMRTVFMHVYIFYLFRIDISANMISPIDNKIFLALFSCFVSEYRTEEPGAYYQIIILAHKSHKQSRGAEGSRFFVQGSPDYLNRGKISPCKYFFFNNSLQRNR